MTQNLEKFTGLASRADHNAQYLSSSHPDESAASLLAGIAGPLEKQKDTMTTVKDSALTNIELLYAHSQARPKEHRQSNPKDRDSRLGVVLVGAGIVNLMTAELLARNGYKVRVVDAGPSPKLCQDWTRLGVTNGGGNARMFTNTEADNYNETGNEIYQDMHSVFRSTVYNGGWGMKESNEFTAAELSWVDAFEQIPPSLAQTIKGDIYEVNLAAGKLWKEYFESYPDLFETVQLRKNILRLYVEPVALEASTKLNRQLGSLIQAPCAEQFLCAYPGFRYAAQHDHLAGGIIVDGFTLNIHPFMETLMDRITGLGGEVFWNCQVNSIQRNSKGEVINLESSIGSLDADHYIVSPGVNAGGLLRGTGCENLIHGVLGVWLQIPNLHPQIEHSIKIHRRHHLVEDINITIAKDTHTGEDVLIFGGGYGYVGFDRPAPDNPHLAALFDELEEVARIYFPRGYAAAKERNTMYPNQTRKYCIRPFTSTGLGVFESIPSASGGHLIITGGNNTGGFAQAPAIARAVWRKLMGEHDPVHVVFHPNRSKALVDITTKATDHLADPS